ncbi:MAG: exo-rhamnogalacturonan lyase family protein, partial [Kiritimatiellia bacterium]
MRGNKMEGRVVRRLLAGLLLNVANLRAEFAIPLLVEETGGVDRTIVVSSGVPLRPGQLHDVNRLRVLDAEGKEIPAQFRVLARWALPTAAEEWRRDGSLRWVLVDFRANLKAFETHAFTLTDGRSTNYNSRLKVEETDELITVTTGPARFVINRKRFNLFDMVAIDLNGDGVFTAEEECVIFGKSPGSVVEDTYGQIYVGSAGVKEVKIEEAGPIRVCVVAKGVHRAPGGKGYSRGMYQYDTRLHFFAESSVVRVDHVINNCFPDPIGTPTFEDHSLVLRMNIEGDVSNNPELKDRGPFVMGRICGVAPLDEAMQEGESLCLYQDSNGAETWQVNPGFFGPETGKLSTFRGYRILRRTTKGEEILAQGDHARGVVEFQGKRFGLVIVPRHFWQKFPKAIEVGYDGTVRIGILPREHSHPHWLQDAAGSGQELWLYFYARGLQPPAVSEFARDNETRSQWWNLLRDRPWPHVVADALLPDVFVRCPPEHYAACGALADIGPYLPIKGGRPFSLAVNERRYFTTDYLKGNAYGWQVFGSRWEEQKGHSPANYEPISSSDYLFNYINTGAASWLELGRRRNMHFRDVRSYKIDDDKRFSYRSWAEFRDNAECEDFCGRAPRMPPDEEAKKYAAGFWPRESWELPNPEHNNLDELYDLYCLFGDTRALEGMVSVAAVGGAYVGMPGGRVNIHRASGWCLRSVLRYYELTADRAALNYITNALDNCWAMVRREGYRHVPKINYDNTWFYNVFGRAIVLAYYVTADERIRDLAIGMTQNRTSKLQHPTLNAFCYDQTGDKRYYSELAENYARLGGYFPACDGYLWAKPRPDQIPPGAVTDLKATISNGDIVLTWTAPGDDDRKGTAAVYQLKWAELPIVELAEKSDQCSFWAAENLPGEPKPAPAGTRAPVP